MAFVQRYPFSPKAIWWKRYKEDDNIKDKIIYVASKTLGFKLSDFKSFSKVSLYNGKIRDGDSVIYFDITNWKNGELEPTTVIKLSKEFFIYNQEQSKLEKCKIENYKNLEVINVVLPQMLEYEEDIFIRQFQFNCQKANDKKNNTTQSIPGLSSDFSYVTLKTQNFTELSDEPKNDDIVEYKGKFWIISEASKTFLYSPKETSFLYLSLRQISNQDELFSIKGCENYVED